MPFIDSKVSVKTTTEQRKELKERLGQAIEVIPGKSESWLMIDLADERVVSTEEGKKYAETQGYPFFEASAKTGENLEEVFYTLIRSCGDVNENEKKEEKSGKKCIIC